MLCLRQRNETISSVLLVEREGVQIPVSYVSRPLQGMEICYTPIAKMVQILIHTTRSLRTIFRKHKVNVVTDGLMEEILKLSKKEGRLAKWAAEIRTYDISYILRKEAEGSVVKNFSGQGEQVHETLNENEGGTLNPNKELQAKSTPTPRAWRLYLGKETIEEGSGVGIILVSPEEKMHSYVIRLKFNASNHVMDCKALLAGIESRYKRLVPNHTPPKNPEPKSRSVNRVGNYKARIPQLGSISRYQNKTIDRGDNHQQERESSK
ncbi:reverse transcriptase domain-containing protein [Tanacetum coccineum]